MDSVDVSGIGVYVGVVTLFWLLRIAGKGKQPLSNAGRVTRLGELSPMVTRCVCEIIVQNAAQPIFCQS
jgi:hypothetical protein